MQKFARIACWKRALNAARICSLPFRIGIAVRASLIFGNKGVLRFEDERSVVPAEVGHDARILREPRGDVLQNEVFAKGNCGAITNVEAMQRNNGERHNNILLNYCFD